MDMLGVDVVQARKTKAHPSYSRKRFFSGFIAVAIRPVCGAELRQMVGLSGDDRVITPLSYR